MKKYIVSACMLFITTGLLSAAVRVITTTQDLQDIAEEVGGELVQVESLSAGTQDVHMVEPRPSMVMKMKKAQLLVKIGLDLDMWVDSLIAAARNDHIVFGAPGYVDASVGIPLLQIPEGKIDGSMGDIHIFGNPHYWLKPENGGIIAKNICDGLCRTAPEHAAVFKQNYARFMSVLKEKCAAWDTQAASLKGAPLVTYHNSWIYFAERFGFNLIGNVEPKPGLPPTPSHIQELIATMKNAQAKIILVETFFPQQGAEAVAAKTNSKVLIVPSSVGGLPGIKHYTDIFDFIIKHMVEAVK